jgi:alanine racemase
MTSNPHDAPLILTIDLDAVVSNWRFLSSGLDHSTCAAVVKADAYGLGAAKVAPALIKAGCKVFFVATLDEGIALRSAGGDSPLEILVLSGPVRGSEAEYTRHALVPVLNSLEQLEQWQLHCRAIGRAGDAALHVDTGMNRLGLTLKDTQTLRAHPGLLEGVRLVLGLSHLACANEPDHPLNDRQLQLFRQALGPLALPRLSLAASSGIFLGQDYHFDLVRPGAALYGLSPNPDKPNPLRPAIVLQARILQIRDVDSPQTVGYGATHAIKAKGRLATVAAGYADGYFRSLAGRGLGVIKGIKVPVVGRISMDLISFDISHVPPHLINVGDMMDLIGPDHDVDAHAALAQTIGYEILTQLPRRALRTYTGDQS